MMGPADKPPEMCPLLSGVNLEGELVKIPCQGHGCPMWTAVRGKDPQSEREVDQYGCAIAWLPVLILEGAQQTRHAAAAIESFRNEMVRGNQQTAQILLSRMNGAPPRTAIGDRHE